MIELSKIKKIYFIGIGGIGMSAAAGIAAAKGFKVCGADALDIYEPAKGVLDRNGISYKIGYAAENFTGADLVVASSAVDQSNPEYAAALRQNVPIVSFAELLAQLVADKKQIVVIGTHGKGTTAGLIAYVLKNIEDSGFFVGAVLQDLQSNYYCGQGPHFVLEGDEYKSGYDNLTPKFAYFNADILLINNIEFDHPDIYADLAAFKKPFIDLVSRLGRSATIVYNADDDNVLDVIKNSPAKKIGFSFLRQSADILARLPRLQDNNFIISVSNHEKSFNFQTKLPGLPYAYDNLAAITVLIELGFAPRGIYLLIKNYSGVKRRYEIIYDHEITIIDDYAHHPTAVRETLEASRLKYPGRRIVCFFEPHTYSRTKETLAELQQAFSAADLVYIAEVYPAREQKLPSSVSGKEVVAAIAKNHPNVHYVSDKLAALQQFKAIVQPGDVIIVMAVGSFNTLVYDLRQNYGN